MEIRKVLYNIDYVHLIQFKEFYRGIISPYFALDHLEYGIDNENTIHESARLIFRENGFALNIRKEGITFWFEGDSKELMKSNPQLDIFFELLEKIKSIPGFARVTNQRLIVHGIQLEEEKPEDNKEVDVKDLIKNPFGSLDEFAAIYEFKQDSKNLKVRVGNFHTKDISKFKLMDINPNVNSFLVGRKGYLCEIELLEAMRSASVSKFKESMKYCESVFKKFEF
jgi:hypothetical protein